MFIQKCFIRKNTPELRKKLTLLGLKENDIDDFKEKWIAVNYGLYISVSEGFERIHLNDIDCGKNEDLFFAIAALRDDSDKNQWFTDGDNDFWFISGDENCNCTIQYYKETYNKNIHKATVQELINHFQNKN